MVSSSTRFILGSSEYKKCVHIHIIINHSEPEGVVVLVLSLVHPVPLPVQPLLLVVIRLHVHGRALLPRGPVLGPGVLLVRRGRQWGLFLILSVQSRIG